MTDPDNIWKEISNRSNISRASFTEEEVINAGFWGAPQPPVTEATGPFRRELGKMLKTEEEINWMMDEYWMLLNNEHSPLTLIQELLDENPQTTDSVNSLVSGFINWGNNIPKWIVKGNSSNHTFEMYEGRSWKSVHLS